MAELINLVTWTGINVTPMDDALIYESAVGGHGMFYGGTVSIKNENTLHIAAGHGIICGRKFTIVEGDIQIELAPSGSLNGRVYIHLDLSNASEPIEILIQTASSLSPPIQDDDVNIINGIYEIDLARFSVNTVTISNVVNVAPSVRISRNNDNIGPAEVSPALQSHAKGTYLIYNNTLYEVTQAISPGTALTVNGNIKEVKVSDAITALNTAVTALQTSGVTVGTYGPSANVTGNEGATINVPQITVDKSGRITSAVNRTLTNKNTTYGNATTSAAGLMSAGDKQKIDRIGSRSYLDGNITTTAGGPVEAGSSLAIPSAGLYLILLNAGVMENQGTVGSVLRAGIVVASNGNKTGFGWAPTAPNKSAYVSSHALLQFSRADSVKFFANYPNAGARVEYRIQYLRVD